MKFTNNQEVKFILSQLFDEALLIGFESAILSLEKDKFFAYSIVNLSDVNYEDFSWYHSQMAGHSASLNEGDYAKSIIIYDNESQSSKTKEQCLEEKVYAYFSIFFIGILFENEWYVLPNIHFYGSSFNPKTIKDKIENEHLKYSSFYKGIWIPKPKEESIEIHGRQKIMRNPPFEEFSDHPYLVAIVKQRKKEEINNLYSTYFNKAFIEPFFLKVKHSNPDNYRKIIPLRDNYTMIYSVQLDKIIFVAFIKNSLCEWRLKYFLYYENEFYEWIFFISKVFEFQFYYGALIIEDLKTISCLDDDGYLDSSCTMDDINFWDSYVLKSNTEGKYLYLNKF